MAPAPPAPLPLPRFETILDAYGADPARWPEAERDAARALLDVSSAARARRDAAARLDALLDLVPALVPADGLAARIVAAAAPVRSPRRRVAAIGLGVPLAAAAALAVWLVRGAGTPGPAPSLPREDAPLAAAESFDRLTAPTDELLEVTGLYDADELPSLGCSDGELGCPDLPRAEGRRSGLRAPRIPA